MSVIITPESQHARLDHLLRKLDDYLRLSPDDLQLRNTDQGWSIAEVMQHMIIAQSLYIPKIDKALAVNDRHLPAAASYTANPIAGFLLKRFPPIKGQIRMKMKTMKKFEPVHVVPETVRAELHASILQLKNWIERAQQGSFTRKRFSSAVGNLVRFNVPEACEFFLCHNERHFQQIDNILSAHSKP